MRVPKFGAAPATSGAARPVDAASIPTPPAIQQGEQVAQALGNFGRGIGALGQQVQDEVDQAEVQAAANLYDEYTRNVLDPTKGFSSKIGQDARDTYEDTVAQLEDKRKEFGQRLQNARQRRLYEQYSMNRRDRARGYVDRHAAQQVRALNIGEAEAKVLGAARDYSAIISGESTVAIDAAEEMRALEEYRQSLRNVADLQGLGEAATAEFMRTAESALLLDATTRLTERATTPDEVEEAQRVVDAFESRMTPQQLDNLNEVLKDKRQTIELVERSNRVTSEVNDLFSASAVDGPDTPEERTVRFRQSLQDYVDRSNLTPDEQSSVLKFGDALIKRMQSRHLELGAAAFERAKRDLQAQVDAGQFPILERLPNYLDLRKYGQLDSVERLIDRFNDRPEKPLSMEAEEFLIRLELGETVTVPGQGSYEFRTMSRDQVGSLLNALGAVEGSDVHKKYVRKYLEIRRESFKDAKQANDAAVDAQIDVIAGYLGINKADMRSGADPQKQADTLLQYRLLQKNVRDYQLLNSNGIMLNPDSTVQEWQAATLDIVDLLGVQQLEERMPLSQAQGMSRPEFFEAAAYTPLTEISLRDAKQREFPGVADKGSDYAVNFQRVEAAVQRFLVDSDMRFNLKQGLRILRQLKDNPQLARQMRVSGNRKTLGAYLDEVSADASMLGDAPATPVRQTFELEDLNRSGSESFIVPDTGSDEYELKLPPGVTFELTEGPGGSGDQRLRRKN